MIFEIKIEEVFLALFTRKFLLLEKGQYDPVDLLEALLLLAVWTFLLIDPLVLCSLHSPPPSETVMAIQILAFAALLRILHNIVADAASETLLERICCHVRREARPLTAG